MKNLFDIAAFEKAGFTDESERPAHYISKKRKIMTNEEIIASVQLYRILHKPTGLFYKPGYVNLSKKGKVYTRNQASNIASSTGTTACIGSASVKI